MTGTRFSGSPQEFEDRINALCTSEADLKDGYAPFCKHVFVKNFTDAKCPVIEITPEVEPLIQTAYKARTEKVQYLSVCLCVCVPVCLCACVCACVPVSVPLFQPMRQSIS